MGSDVSSHFNQSFFSQMVDFVTTEKSSELLLFIMFLVTGIHNNDL